MSTLSIEQIAPTCKTARALVDALCCPLCPRCAGAGGWLTNDTDRPDWRECDLCNGTCTVAHDSPRRVAPIVAAYWDARSSLVTGPAATKGRLERALAIVLNGQVDLGTDPIHGNNATVDSCTHADVQYHINGRDCDCPDTWARNINCRKACKHQLSVWIAVKAASYAAERIPGWQSFDW